MIPYQIYGHDRRTFLGTSKGLVTMLLVVGKRQRINASLALRGNITKNTKTKNKSGILK
jgi:hypothetical protein